MVMRASARLPRTPYEIASVITSARVLQISYISTDQLVAKVKKWGKKIEAQNPCLIWRIASVSAAPKTRTLAGR